MSMGLLSELSWLPFKVFAKIRDNDASQILLDMADYDIEKKFSMSLPRLDKGLSRQLRVFGFREPLNCRCYVDFVDANDTVLDIGSNIGFFVLLGSSAKKLICVEPLTDAVEMLKSNVELNHLADKCEILHAAVGPEGKLLVEVNPQLNLSKIVKEKSENTIEVDSIPLEKLVAQRPSNMVRLDVEGFEYEILYNHVPKSINKISMEFHTDLLGEEKSRRLLTYFQDEGFTVKYFIEDVPLRFYPFLRIFKSTGIFSFISYVVRDADFATVEDRLFEGRGLKYLFLQR